MRSNLHFRQIAMVMIGWKEAVWKAGRVRDQSSAAAVARGKKGAAWRDTWWIKSNRGLGWKEREYSMNLSPQGAFLLGPNVARTEDPACTRETSISLPKAPPLCSLLITRLVLYSQSQEQKVFLKLKWNDPIWSSHWLLLKSFSLFFMKLDTMEMT